MFRFRLERPDGSAAEPPRFETSVPNWEPGHTIPHGSRTLRVVGVRWATEPGDESVLVVEDD